MHFNIGICYNRKNLEIINKSKIDQRKEEKEMKNKLRKNNLIKKFFLIVILFLFGF